MRASLSAGQRRMIRKSPVRRNVNDICIRNCGQPATCPHKNQLYHHRRCRAACCKTHGDHFVCGQRSFSHRSSLGSQYGSIKHDRFRLNRRTGRNSFACQHSLPNPPKTKGLCFTSAQPLPFVGRCRAKMTALSSIFVLPFGEDFFTGLGLGRTPVNHRSDVQFRCFFTQQLKFYLFKSVFSHRRAP